MDKHMLFRAYSPRYGMSEPFRLFDEIEFHNVPDGGMSAIVKHTDVEIKHLIIMQYTGRDATDGTKIFFDDIIKTTYNDVGSGWDITDTGLVVFEHGCYQYRKYYRSGPLCSRWSDKRTKVIGNKHQNPDLLSTTPWRDKS